MSFRLTPPGAGTKTSTVAAPFSIFARSNPKALNRNMVKHKPLNTLTAWCYCWRHAEPSSIVSVGPQVGSVSAIDAP
jgi:hypothetical protein